MIFQNLFSGFGESVCVANKSIKNVSIGSRIDDAFVQSVSLKLVSYFIELSFLDQVIVCSCDQLFLTEKGWRRAQNLTINDKLITFDDQKILINSVEYKQEKIWLYDISLTKYFVFPITKYKILVHNEAMVAALCWTYGGGIAFEGISIGLASLLVIAKAGREVYQATKNGFTNAYKYIKSKFSSPEKHKEIHNNKTFESTLAQKTNQNIKIEEQKSSDSKINTINNVQNITTTQKEEIKIAQQLPEIKIIQNHQSVILEQAPVIQAKSYNQVIEETQNIIDDIKLSDPYYREFSNISTYYSAPVIQNNNSLNLLPINYLDLNRSNEYINFNEPVIQPFESDGSYFNYMSFDWTGVGQALIDQLNEKRNFEHTCQMMRAQGYEWDEIQQVFVPIIYNFNSNRSDSNGLADVKNQKPEEPLCCPLTCGCRCQKEMEEVEKQIVQNGGKRTKFDFENAEDEAITKAPKIDEWKKGMNHPKYGDFLFDKINNIWWTGDVANTRAHGGMHWKIYKKVGKYYERICQVVRLKNGCVKVMNKNKNGKHIIPVKEFNGLKKPINEVDWLIDLYKKLHCCPCKVCICK